MLRKKSLEEIQNLIRRYPVLREMQGELVAATQTLAECFSKGGKVLVCGNGGSAADSVHIVGELMKGFVLRRRLRPELQAVLTEQWPETARYYIENLQETLSAISLVNEIGLMTAYSNDKVSDLVFAQQVLGYGRKGDVLLGISTSGNSSNVVHAEKIARSLEMKVISLTGKGGGALSGLSDVLLAVPSTITYQIQEYHLPIYHAICLALEKEFFNE